ncbi:MAG TPA: hypothetical protein VM121_04770 [Acidimicrobiales bacterium]|nr:hypothetical protein [Acidimicrobiales bacterium]
MSFRLGFVIGGGVGYYLGSKAGRQRYDQINRAVRRLKRSDAFETATDKAKSTLGDGVEKARDLVGSRVGDGDNGDAPGTMPPTRFP